MPDAPGREGESEFGADGRDGAGQAGLGIDGREGEGRGGDAVEGGGDALVEAGRYGLAVGVRGEGGCSWMGGRGGGGLEDGEEEIE